jgi:hypothetical protein
VETDGKSERYEETVLRRTRIFYSRRYEWSFAYRKPRIPDA